MSGMYHLLSRIELPYFRFREGRPRWGVRHSLTSGNLDPQLIGDAILPISGQPDVASVAYYDFGQFEIGYGSVISAEHKNTLYEIKTEAALLGMGASPTDAELTQNWIRFDDFRLIPAESFIYIDLDSPINANDVLVVRIDEQGNAEVYTVNRPVPSADGSGDRTTIRQRITNVVVGENGFTMPNTLDAAVVMVADMPSGGLRSYPTDATIDRVRFTVKAGEYEVTI